MQTAAAAPLAAAPPPGTAVYPLPRLPFLRLRFTLRSVTGAVLPSYKGSTLRGAFGHALRRAVCAMGRGQECADCRLREMCAYTRIFETFLDGEPPPFLRGLEAGPRPYVFEPNSEARVFAPGEPLEFDLLLIGQAVDLQAYAQLAVERMAANGLGRERCRFELDRIDALAAGGAWLTVFAGGKTRTRGLLPPLLPPEDGPAARATLRFLTPTRLKLGSHLRRDVTFRGLAFAMLRRTLELAQVHLPQAPHASGSAIDWHIRPLLEQAGRVRVVRSNLTWHDWERYSNRQGRKMTLGGFEGTLEIEGDLTPFAPLLRTAEILHVGKGATFGLGRMAIEG